tara:strand:+ start:1347 stop:1856 length:510 start_codon:yes stop_codon:yes gene_type:complete
MSTLFVNNLKNAAGNGIPYTTGAVLQVKNAILTTHFEFTNTSFVDITGLTVNITPNSSNSKMLVTAHLGAVSGGGAHAQMFGFVRDSTVIGQSTSSATTLASFGQYYGNNTQYFAPMSGQVLDEPNTTSQITYKLQGKTSGSTTYINRWASNNSQFGFSSSITVMEIGG